MRFLLDMNLPRALADRLRAEGHDAVHAYDVGQGNLQDRDIFRRAAADRRVVVTFDLDFGEIVGTQFAGNGCDIAAAKTDAAVTFVGPALCRDRGDKRGP